MVVLVRAALSLRASLSLCSSNRVSLLANKGVSLRGLRISSHPSVGFRNGRFLGGITIPQPVILPTLRRYATIPTTSSVKTFLLDGCDYEHWLIVMGAPEGNPTRDEIIDSYIKTLAQVVGSEEEARMKMYSVSTKHYFAFGCLVSEELSYKIKPLPNVLGVWPDAYSDPRTKSYGGEPFINGQAVPYGPKYHEEWVRNNAC
ncbi:multiple organellar RNA editing factor 8, chloroplastic/mitochondrial isoform X2 [Cryptomeria japonica]|uniref:multiple organellar RNA editing factor 8, chloroplastic/mitochondrial isoform X2 n=1 Tax=Cryptomeria japonica TaxID=3369 RepID=UPI0027DAB1E5|nr:multiple organellar RNA editing factor 8, chloroplastic/mitochondrial isoform X2 [Cryptomeria japonica]